MQDVFKSAKLITFLMSFLLAVPGCHLAKQVKKQVTNGTDNGTAAQLIGPNSISITVSRNYGSKEWEIEASALITSNGNQEFLDTINSIHFVNDDQDIELRARNDTPQNSTCCKQKDWLATISDLNADSHATYVEIHRTDGINRMEMKAQATDDSEVGKFKWLSWEYSDVQSSDASTSSPAMTFLLDHEGTSISKFPVCCEIDKRLLPKVT